MTQNWKKLTALSSWQISVRRSSFTAGALRRVKVMIPPLSESSRWNLLNPIYVIEACHAMTWYSLKHCKWFCLYPCLHLYKYMQIFRFSKSVWGFLFSIGYISISLTWNIWSGKWSLQCNSCKCVMTMCSYVKFALILLLLPCYKGHVQDLPITRQRIRPFTPSPVLSPSS